VTIYQVRRSYEKIGPQQLATRAALVCAHHMLKGQGYTAWSLEDDKTIAVSGVHGQVLDGDHSDQTKRWQDLLMQG
jgi:hypothetical protein